MAEPSYPGIVVVVAITFIVTVVLLVAGPMPFPSERRVPATALHCCNDLPEHARR